MLEAGGGDEVFTWPAPKAEGGPCKHFLKSIFLDKQLASYLNIVSRRCNIGVPVGLI